MAIAYIPSYLGAGLCGDPLRLSTKRVILSCTIPALWLEPRPYAQSHSFWRDQFVILQIINHNLDHIINDLIF